jgi:hypothetical protein
MRAADGRNRSSSFHTPGSMPGVAWVRDQEGAFDNVTVRQRCTPDRPPIGGLRAPPIRDANSHGGGSPRIGTRETSIFHHHISGS